MNDFKNIFIQMLQKNKKVEMNELFDIWFMEKKNAKLKAQSLNTYNQYLEHYLRPAFGNILADEVTTEEIQRFIDEMIHKKSTKTIHEIFNRLKNVLNIAVDQKMIMVNPCDKVVLPKYDYSEAKSLSVEEQKMVEKTVRDPKKPHHVAILLALNLGLRLSEITALRWCDVDFKKGFVYIKHSMERISVETKDGLKKENHLGTPKTKNSIRKIPLNIDFSKILENYYKGLTPSQKDPQSFVVSKSNGTYYSGRTVQRYFKKILKQLELSEEYSFHSLRHSFATKAMENGVEIKVISMLMGHSKTTTTMDIYCHLSDRHIKNEMKKLEWTDYKHHRYHQEIVNQNKVNP